MHKNILFFIFFIGMPQTVFSSESPYGPEYRGIFVLEDNEIQGGEIPEISAQKSVSSLSNADTRNASSSASEFSTATEIISIVEPSSSNSSFGFKGLNKSRTLFDFVFTSVLPKK